MVLITKNAWRALGVGGLGLVLAAVALGGGTAMTFMLAFVGAVARLACREGRAADHTGGGGGVETRGTASIQ